ncbi:MAG: helix-turn-helix transcriptional regulator, partial [Clostridia bacterium]|nr:helix-turn-helix transcriptional regulator [Clostridia bacterium]
MDDIGFCNSFAFRVFSFQRHVHTDNSHGIPHHFFGKLLCGRGRIEPIEGEPLDLQEGDVFYLPMGLCYHSYWTPSVREGTVSWESYRFEWIPQSQIKHYALQKFSCTEKELAWLGEIKKTGDASARDVGLLYTFLGSVLPRMANMNTDPRRQLLIRAEAYISEHLDLQVPSLARHLGMSESGLYAFFQSYAHTTPVKIKNRILVEKAIPLLCDTDLSVEEICARLGFQTAAYFRKL